MRLSSLVFALTLAHLRAQVPEVRTTALDRSDLSVTLYSDNLAVIRDSRRVTLPAGQARLAFADVLPSIRPKSATILTADGDLRILERNFEFNVLTPHSLVKASLGQHVGIHGEDGGPGRKGTLTGFSNPISPEAQKAFARNRDENVLVAFPGSLQSSSSGALTFFRVPAELRSSPALMQDVLTHTAGEREFTLVYSATGLSWSPHYVATLDPDGDHLDLTLMATVENLGDVPLPMASMQLLVGSPTIVPEVAGRDFWNTQSWVTVEVCADIAPGPPVFKEEKLSEYPVFTLDHPVTLQAKANKQFVLMKVERVPVTQYLLVEYPYEDYGFDSPSAFFKSPLFQEEPPVAGPSAVPRDLQAGRSLGEEYHWDWIKRHHPPLRRMGVIRNRKESNLGRTLPGGTLDLRYRDPQGAEISLASLPGSADEFPMTPAGEETEIFLGPARALATRRACLRRTANRVDSPQGMEAIPTAQQRWEYQIQVRFTSSLPTASRITVREPLPAAWELLDATQPGHRSGSSAYDFEVLVPAQGEATLLYTVLTSPEPQPGPT